MFASPIQRSTLIQTTEFIDTQQTDKAAQYSVPRILGVWAAAALPMGILGWIIGPALSPDIATNPVGAVAVRYAALTLGLMWMFVLSLIIVYREEGDLRWATIQRRLRLNTPRDPRTGDSRRRLWFWLVPLVVLTVLWQLRASPLLSGVWTSMFPFFAEPSAFALRTVLSSPAGQGAFVGAWGLLALFALNAIFNTILGEELLFRGVLLPKMNGAFGRWDWLANGLLFGLYHLHQPWGMLGSAAGGALLYALPAKVFKSTWMSIIVHSMQSLYFLFLILGLVLGLA